MHKKIIGGNYKNIKFRNLNIVLLIIATICFIEFLFIAKNVANAEINTQPVVLSEQSDNGDPYYGTKEYWDELNGEHENASIPIKANSILSDGDYYVDKDIKITCPAATSAYIISGKVNIYFQDNHKLEIIGGATSNKQGSAPGINLLEGSELNISGKGNLIINGASVNANAAAKDSPINGANGPAPYDTSYDGNCWEHGNCATGGNGTGGVAAVIGSAGGNGGLGGIDSEPRLRSGYNTMDAVNGRDGKDGSNGGGSAKCGNLTLSGNLSVYLYPGHLNMIGTPTQAINSGMGTHCLTEGRIVYDYTYVGAAGGAGQGGYGFLGAIIGSGGSGGGGGGAGGLGGKDYSKHTYTRNCYPNAGGGGAGFGSRDGFGGTANQFKSDNMGSKAEDGGEFVYGTSTSGGKGGIGSKKKGKYMTARGGNGGNGGNSAYSGGSGVVYMVPGEFSNDNYYDEESENDGVDYSQYEGRESARYLVYPQNDCELVLYGGIGDNMFEYEGAPVEPSFDLIYKPTGKVIDKSCYSYEWVNNDSPGEATLIVRGFNSLSTSKATLGKSIKEAAGELSINFTITNFFNVENFTFEPEKTYDGEPMTYSKVGGEPYVINSKGATLSDVKVSDLEFHYSKYDYEKKEWISLGAEAPKDFGSYQVELSIKKTPYDYWVCTTLYRFEINKSHITIDGEKSEGFTVEKDYDATNKADYSQLYGSVSLLGVANEEEYKKISVKPVLKDYTFIEKGRDTISCKLEYTGEDDVLENYTIETTEITVAYIIDVRKISVLQIIPKSRSYQKGNYDAEIDKIEFGNLCDTLTFEEGAQWTYVGNITDGSDQVGIHDCEFRLTINAECKSLLFENSEKECVIDNLNVDIYGDVVPLPEVSDQDFYYTGEPQTYPSGPRSGDYTVDNYIQTYPGTYDVIYTLCEGKEWNIADEEQRTKPYIIKWTINKHEALDFEEETFSLSVNDLGDKQYTIKCFNDLPNDFKIERELIDVTYGYDYLYSYGTFINKEDKILKVQLNPGSKEDDYINIDIIWKTAFYEDTVVHIKCELTGKYNAEISGVKILSKTYDRQYINVDLNDLKIVITDELSTERDITNRAKQYLRYDFYEFDGQDYKKIDEIPINAGKYYCIARLDDNFAYAEGCSEKIEFEIYKLEKLELPNVVEERCYAISNLEYVGQLNINKIPEGQKYDITVGAITGNVEIVATAGEIGKQISVDNDGHITIVLNKDNIEINKVLFVDFNVEFQNYQSTTISYTLNIVDKTKLEVGGVEEIIDIDYDGKSYLGYTGTFFIKLGDIDLTDELIDAGLVAIIYKNRNTGEIFEEPQKNAGWYEIKVVVKTDSELYKGESDPYYGRIREREINCPATATVVKDYDGNTSIPQHYYTDALPIENVLDEDINKVSAHLKPADYTTPDACAYTGYSEVVIEGEAASNYAINDDYINITTYYQINPRRLTIKDVSTIQREYDPNNYSVNLGVTFNNVVEGESPAYTATGHLVSNVVADDNTIDKYTVSFEPGNYSFWDDRSVWSITVTVDPEKDPLFAKITKAAALKFENNYGQFTYTSEQSFHEGKLDLNVIPLGQSKTITLKETTGDTDILDGSKEITVTNDGVVNIPLREILESDIGKVLTITFNADLDNYESSLIYYELTIVDKKEVTITGVDFEPEKTYDGEVADYNPDNLKILDEEGTDLTNQLRSSIKYKYFDKKSRETTYEPQWCAGDYNIILFIDYDNADYKGESDPAGILIKPKPIGFKTGEITVTKDYDGTTDLRDSLYNVELDEEQIVEGDESYLKAKANVEKYRLPDVGEWTNDCTAELYWDGPTQKYLNNYVLAEDTVSAKYSITPRNITIKEATAVSRPYNPDNLDVDVEVVFDNVIEGREPYYKAVGKLENPDVTQNAKVNEYTVTLDPESEITNQPKGDYAFYVGGEQVKEITVKDNPIYVEITKGGYIELDQTIEYSTYALDDMNYETYLKLDKIPVGLNYEIDVRNYKDDFSLVEDNKISVDHDGRVNISLNKASLKPYTKLIVNFAVIFDNYNDSIIYYELNFVDKKTVDIGGVDEVISKTYDGDYLDYTGDFYIECDGEDLTDELKNDIVFNYLDKSTGRTYNEAQVNAGDYDITLTISNSNKFYKGISPVYHGTISKREVYPSSSIDIIKEYDGSTNLPNDFNDDVSIDNVIKADEGKVFASLLTESYSSPDVCNYSSQCDVNLYGASSLNYVLAPSYVIVNYQITQRIISVNSATGIDRVYDPDNYNAELNVIFDNVVSSALPEYKAVGYLEDNNVSDNVSIDKYTVTLNPETVKNSDFGNYAFWDGQKKVNEVTIEDKPAYMKITKAAAISFEDTNEKYSAYSQKLDYAGKLNLNALPEGQKVFIGINNIDDPFSIIDNNNISVDNYGNIKILLNRDSMVAGRALKIIFDVAPWNYESSTITFTLNLVEPMPVEFSGITFEDKIYDAESLAYSGDLKITYNSEDVTDLVIPFVITEYSNHDGLHKYSEAPVNAGTYDIVFYVSDECEIYIGRSDTYTASINPRRISIKNAEAVGREYDYYNHNVEVHTDFDNVITGHVPTYNAVGYIKNNEASPSAVVEQYTVTLDSVSINKNAETGNYVFFDGEKEIKEITITDDPLYVEISKNKNLPAIFNIEEINYVNEPGEKTYTFNFDNFPEGMLGKDTRFYKDSTVDEGGVINDWSVNSINGQIYLDTTNKPDVDSTSKLFVRVESNNYENTSTQLNVSVKNSTESSDYVAKTFDYTYIMFVTLIVMFLLSGIYCMTRLYEIYRRQ